MSKFEDMTDEYLRRNYVPAVYQPSIFTIDYEKLKASGITFISFDIDDTIAGLEDLEPSKATKTKFQDLKNMGFQLYLITNNHEGRGERFSKELGIEGQFIANAKKPLTQYFEKLQGERGLQKCQMAHVGNSMMDDIAAGNSFGITTCLVRRVGNLTKTGNAFTELFNMTEGQKLRHELKKRKIWRKHHKHTEGDQYYQLGEVPHYRR